jgi:hypothetical protein
MRGEWSSDLWNDFGRNTPPPTFERYITECDVGRLDPWMGRHGEEVGSVIADGGGSPRLTAWDPLDVSQRRPYRMRPLTSFVMLYTNALFSCICHPPFDDEQMEETTTEGDGYVFCFEGREYDLE